jgi:hypothetical protein
MADEQAPEADALTRSADAGDGAYGMASDDASAGSMETTAGGGAERKAPARRTARRTKGRAAKGAKRQAKTASRGARKTGRGTKKRAAGRGRTRSAAGRKTASRSRKTSARKGTSRKRR